MVFFIFMLTHHDVTVSNAFKVFEEVKDSGVSCVGFKDTGLLMEELAELVSQMRKEGKRVFMEVVSETEESTMKSVENAIKLGVDYLIGGTYVEPTLKMLEGTGIEHFPYIGKIIDHPCLLRGTIDEIVKDARRVESLGADGINLLAYRYDGDVDLLMSSVQDAVRIPLIIAGSVNSSERIRKMAELDMWGFTIGGAVFEKKFKPDGNLKEQIVSINRYLCRNDQLIKDRSKS